MGRAIGLNEPLQGLHSHLNGGGGVLAHILVQAGLFTLLVPDHMEAAAAAAVQGISHHKEGGGLHFTGLDVQALPGLPFVEQLIGYRHTLGAVLAVERVLALNDAYLGTLAQRLGRLDQCGGDLEVQMCIRDRSTANDGAKNLH